MKKILLTTVTIFTIATGFSQTEKGKKFIGGQFSLYGNNNSTLDDVNKNTDNSFTFRLIPNIGYFVKDNLAIGGNLYISVSNQDQTHSFINGNLPPTTSKINSSTYGIGGFVRHYNKITESFHFFINGRIAYNYGMEKTSYSSSSNSTDIKTNTYGLSVAPGLVYFATPKLGIEMSYGSLYYNFSTQKETNSTSPSSDSHGSGSSYGANLNLSAFNLGLNYHF